jgi:hypothetical protein
MMDAGPPMCPTYTEIPPDKDANIAGLVSGYRASNLKPFVLGVLGARYPLGKLLVEEGLRNGNGTDCIQAFIDDKSSANAVMRQLATTVHECGHLTDLGKSTIGNTTYVLRSDRSFACKNGDTTTRGGITFARSRIVKDSFQRKRPVCRPGQSGNCDIYADVYLDGNPDNGSFESGDQGFNSLLEEALQYVNSLATSYAFQDAYGNFKQSERDGVLTMHWYLARYLKLARESYPDTYQLLSEDACWRQGILDVWDRGDFYLDKTRGISALGIEDAAIEALAKDPALMAEIDALRKLACP